MKAFFPSRCFTRNSHGTTYYYGATKKTTIIIKKNVRTPSHFSCAYVKLFKKRKKDIKKSVSLCHKLKFIRLHLPAYNKRERVAPNASIHTYLHTLFKLTGILNWVLSSLCARHTFSPLSAWTVKSFRDKTNGWKFKENLFRNFTYRSHIKIVATLSICRNKWIERNGAPKKEQLFCANRLHNPLINNTISMLKSFKQ